MLGHTKPAHQRVTDPLRDECLLISFFPDPIHLHGHDFVILAQKNSTFNETTEVPTFNLNNPARRDVALLYAGGYLALAFRPDNPGVWLLHCHIAFHAVSF